MVISFTAMINSVKVIQEYGSRLPEALRADLEIKFFKLFTQIESIQNTLRPNAIYEIEKPLLNQQEEEKKYGKLTEVRQIHSPA